MHHAACHHLFAAAAGAAAGAAASAAVGAGAVAAGAERAADCAVAEPWFINAKDRPAPTSRADPAKSHCRADRGIQVAVLARGEVSGMD